MQVSSSKKWLSKPALDEQGKPILQKNGKPVLRKSYSVLQYDFYNAMRRAGYHDVERGERGSSEEHLTVTQFKVEQEQARLEALDTRIEKKAQTLEKLQKQQVSIKGVEQIEAKPIPLSSKVAVEKEDYQMLVTAAKKYVTQEKKERKLRSLLKTAEAKIVDLTAKLAAATKELSEYKSLRGKLKTVGLEQENATLHDMVSWYRSVIEKQGIGHLFNRPKQHQQDRDSR